MLAEKQHYYVDFHFCPKCGSRYESAFTLDPLVFTCRVCNFEFYQNSKPSAVVLIPCQEQPYQVLMLRRATSPQRGKLALPGGILNYNEDPAQAAIREIYEEIGLSVKLRKLLRVTKVSYEYRGSLYSMLETAFLAHPVYSRLPLKSSHEAREILFCKLDLLFSDACQLAFPEQIFVIKDYSNIAGFTPEAPSACPA